MGAPHILSAYTAPSAVSRNRRGCPSLRVVRDVYLWPADTWSRLEYHRVHTPARDPTVASVSRITVGVGEPAFGPGVSWAASTLERPQVDVADHSEVMTPRRFRDTADRPGYSDKVCGAPIFRSATSLDRGHRPSETPGPSGGEQLTVERRRAATGRAAQPRRGTISSKTIRQPSGRRCQIRA